MAIKNLIAYPLIPLLLIGCAGLGEKERQDLNKELSSIKTSLEETGARVEELNNKFILLHEKVEAQRAEIEKAGKVPSAPPEGLKVVSLGEETEAVKEKGQKRAEAPREAVDKRPAESAEAMYNRAQDMFMAGAYAEARDIFSALVKAHPSSSLADNALYWVGESYYSEKEYEKAADKFKEAADRYPGGNKAPDALLKVAFSYLEINNSDRAKDALELLIKRYPETEAAKKAGKTLDKAAALKKEGQKRKD